MNDSRAVPGLMCRQLRLALEDADRRARTSPDQLARHGKADDPSADDCEVTLLRRLRGGLATLNLSAGAMSATVAVLQSGFCAVPPSRASGRGVQAVNTK